MSLFCNCRKRQAEIKKEVGEMVYDIQKANLPYITQQIGALHQMVTTFEDKIHDYYERMKREQKKVSQEAYDAKYQDLEKKFKQLEEATITMVSREQNKLITVNEKLHWLESEIKTKADKPGKKKSVQPVQSPITRDKSISHPIPPMPRMPIFRTSGKGKRNEL